MKRQIFRIIHPPVFRIRSQRLRRKHFSHYYLNFPKQSPGSLREQDMPTCSVSLFRPIAPAPRIAHASRLRELSSKFVQPGDHHQCRFWRCLFVDLRPPLGGKRRRWQERAESRVTISEPDLIKALNFQPAKVEAVESVDGGSRRLVANKLLRELERDFQERSFQVS